MPALEELKNGGTAAMEGGASMAPRSKALLQSRLPKAASPDARSPKARQARRRQQQQQQQQQQGGGEQGHQERSTTPSAIPVQRQHSAAARAGMARLERKQRLGGSARSRDGTSSEDEDVFAQVDRAAPRRQGSAGRAPKGGGAASSAGLPPRPSTPAGPRPGDAPDPQYAGVLSREAIAAATHDAEPASTYELKLRAAGIARIENLGPLSKLRQLDLSSNKIARVEGLESLRELRELKLFANRLSVIEGLEGAAGLRVLALQHNQIGRIDGLQRLTKLQQLRLDNNCIAKIENLEANTQLTHLNLGGNLIEKVEGMLSLALLEELQLNGNHITEVHQLPGRALLELSLADNELGQPGGAQDGGGKKKRSCLAGLQGAKRLNSLDLSGNCLCGELSSQMPRLGALETLNLDSNQLQHLGHSKKSLQSSRK